MSMSNNYYAIAGIDLTDFVTDKYKEWKWTKEGETYTCYQSKGNIQLFDDPMNGEFLYLGYIFSANDEYNFKTVKIDLNEIQRQYQFVINKLMQLINCGVISKDIIGLSATRYKLIIFNECR